MPSYEELLKKRDQARMNRVGMTEYQKQINQRALDQSKAAYKNQKATVPDGIPTGKGPGAASQVPDGIPTGKGPGAASQVPDGIPTGPGPGQRNQPTVATETNPVIKRDPLADMPQETPQQRSPDQMIEDIAIKTYNGEDLTDEEMRFQVQQSINKYGGTGASQDQDIQTQNGYYRSGSGSPLIPLPSGYRSEEEFAQRDPEGYDQWADANGYGYSFDDGVYYDSLPFSIEDYINASPEQQMNMQNMAFMDYARNLAGITSEGFDVARRSLDQKEVRQQDELLSEKDKLEAEMKDRLDEFRDVEMQNRRRAITSVEKAGQERIANIKDIQSFSGFGRSTKTMELIDNASEETQQIIADIEMESNRVISDYEVSLLARMDEKLQTYEDRIEATRTEKDDLDIAEIEAQMTLAIDLFKQSPSNPQNMIANAEKLKEARLAEIQAEKEEMAELKKAARDNFEFMVNTFGSSYLQDMTPEQLETLSANTDIPVQVLQNMPATIAEQKQAWEELKYYGNQEFEIQKMLYGNELDQMNAVSEFNRQLKKMGIEHQFDLDILAEKFTYDVNLASLKEEMGNSKALSKWNAIIGDLGGQYNQIAAGGDENGVYFSVPVTHPSTNVGVTSLNVNLAQAYPDGFKFSTKDLGTLAGQCKWFNQQLTVLSNGKGWTIGSTLEDTKKNFEKYRSQGLGFRVGEREAVVGNTVLTSDSLTYGHSFTINAITEDGKWVATESNYSGPLTVSNSRIVDPNSSKIIGVLDTKPRAKYQVPEELLSAFSTAASQAPVAEIFPLLGKALGSAIEGKLNDAITAGMAEIEASKDPSNIINNNGFLSNVASGATELSFSEESELAEVSPQFYGLYQQAKAAAAKNKELKQLTDTGIQKVSQFDSLAEMTRRLEELAKVIEFDPIKGQATQYNLWDPDIQEYQAIKNAITGPAARQIMSEVGALTVSDLQRVEKLIPNITDTPETAKRKIALLKGLIEKGRSNMLQNYSRYGYDVGEQDPISGGLIQDYDSYVNSL